MENIKKRNTLLGGEVVKALKKRHFDAYYCETSEEALELAKTLIPKEDVVSWGGSKTAVSIGLIDAVKESNEVINRDAAKNPEEKMQLMRDALNCDTYIAGINGISLDGQLVNVDGNGNRVAAITFGPKNVILVAGINKVVATAEEALSRTRNIAAPINAQKFEDLQTPCKLTGKCGDCLSPESCCAYIQQIRVCRPAGKIKVILIGEELGY